MGKQDDRIDQGLKGPQRKKKSRRNRRSSGKRTDGLSVEQIVKQYGGTHDQWNQLIVHEILHKAQSQNGATVRVNDLDVKQYVRRAVDRQLELDAPLLPKIVLADEEVVIAGSTVPIRLLYRAIKSGSSEAALRGAFPELPDRSMDAILDYARKDPAIVESWQNEPVPIPFSEIEEEDDDAEFTAEYEELLKTHEDLFRQLAK